MEGILLEGLKASNEPNDHNDLNGENGHRGVAQPG